MNDLDINIPMLGATLSDSALLEFSRRNTEIQLKLTSPYDGESVVISPTMTANNAPSPFVVSADSEYNYSYAAWKAMDGLIDSHYYSGAVLYHGWWKLDFGVPTFFNRVDITAPPSGDLPGAPGDFTIEGSNDGIIWHTLSTQTGQTWTASETKSFSFSGLPYQICKINCTATQGADAFSVSEIVLYAQSQWSNTLPVSEILKFGGVAGSTFKLSTFIDSSDTDGEQGSINMQYSFFNQDDGSDISWNGSWLTIAAFQALSDVTNKKWGILKFQHVSNGMQDACISDSSMVVSIPSGGGGGGGISKGRVVNQ